MQRFSIQIDMEPKAQSRPRFARMKDHVRTYDKKDMKLWRVHCTALIKELYDGPKFEEAVMVTATFYVKPPKYISDKKKNKEPLEREEMWIPKKPDLDNYIKALLDSMSDSECIWKDDGQVACLVVKKKYSMTPRIELELQELN